jgi:hypothetical protein
MAGLSVPRGSLKADPRGDSGASNAAAAEAGNFRYEVNRAVSALDLLDVDLTNEKLLREKLLKVGLYEILSNFERFSKVVF